ncbi:BTAD domain-containing putative transcriptional regulator [Streptomyces massasporeus]|uniref:BTAD domain-containing putative transcriptional regulator n=1 Tax=Streptomyces massasporeus TaxID=67324 RepID=UPI00364EDD40
MEFRLLGPLEVEPAGGPPGSLVDLGGHRQRAVLAYLLLHANKVVSTSQMLSALWADDEAPMTARKILQNAVWKLRGVLSRPPRSEQSPELLTRAPGYLLRVPQQRVDLLDYEQRVVTGRAALAAGDVEPARRSLGEALALWRGPVLSDLVEEGICWPELTALQNRRLDVLEDHFEAALACGRHQLVLPDLESLVAAEPLRERASGQLMVALYRCGRQAEALAVFGRVRTALVEGLGLEPGRELHRLQQAILTQDPTLEVPRTAGDREPADLAPAARPALSPPLPGAAPAPAPASTATASAGPAARGASAVPVETAVPTARSERGTRTAPAVAHTGPGLPTAPAAAHTRPGIPTAPVASYTGRGTSTGPDTPTGPHTNTASGTPTGPHTNTASGTPTGPHTNTASGTPTGLRTHTGLGTSPSPGAPGSPAAPPTPPAATEPGGPTPPAAPPQPATPTAPAADVPAMRAACIDPPARGGPAGSAAAEAPSPGRHTSRTASVLMFRFGLGAELGRVLAEDRDRVVDALTQIAREKTELHGGRVTAVLGSTVLSVFADGADAADRAERAVRTAAAVRYSLSVPTGTLAPPQAAVRGLTVHAAVASGEALLPPRPSDDPPPPWSGGRLVDTCRTMLAHVQAGEIHVCEETHRQVERAATFRRACASAMAPWELHALHDDVTDLAWGPAGAAVHGSELELMHHTLSHTRQRSTAHLITLIEGSGRARTRLLMEFQRRVEERHGPVRVLAGTVPAPHAGSALSVPAEILAAYCGIDPACSAPHTEARLRATLNRLGGDAAGAADLYAPLARLLSPQRAAHEQEMPGEMLRAWGAFLARAAREQPLVLIWDDLQYADDALLDMVERLTQTQAGVPLLTVVGADSRLPDRRPGWATAQPRTVTLSLSPETGDALDRLLESLLPPVRESEVA